MPANFKFQLLDLKFSRGSLAGTSAKICREPRMNFPIKVCAICSEEFELKPGKPGFANHCPECSAEKADTAGNRGDETTSREQNEARREAMKNLLYRKDS